MEWDERDNPNPSKGKGGGAAEGNDRVDKSNHFFYIKKIALTSVLT